MDDFILGYALGLVLFVICAPAKACTIEIHLGSSHARDSRFSDVVFNEENLGIGRECKGWQYGFYENSYNKTSLYAGLVKPIGQYAGVKLGLVTGYADNINIFGSAYIRFMGNELTLIPPSDNNPLTLGYSRRF